MEILTNVLNILKDHHITLHLRKGPNDEIMRSDSYLMTLYIHVEVRGPHALADRVTSLH
jgi:hypothetical protein